MNIKSFSRLLLLASLWGGSFLFMRISAPVLGAIPTAFGRVAFGALGLLAILLVMGVRLSFEGRSKAVLGIGIITSGVPFLMYSLAAMVLPAGYSSILNATTPLMGVVIGGSFFGEQITLKKLMGVAIGLSGVFVLTETGPVAMNVATILAVMACLTATLCYGFASYLTKRLITDHTRIDNRVLAFGSQLGAVFTLAPFMVWQTYNKPIAWAHIGIEVWLSMLALGLLCTSFAYILFFRLIAEIGALKTLTVTFLIPLFGVFWGWLLLGERLSVGYALGGGMIGVALWLVLRPTSRPPHPLAPRTD
ncbi:multidrug DMT transporter permease [Acidihalobacter yilgarnensis]|uniref:Multidrug DMT transporter permease n=1 Tax=Acidihalobacter yilgarnensis TaxID=2819280 RepID=A0A1D8IS27_9GAMM|nr:DMT family transporter [Acidihalobacter yilgarnensis]AOU99302.1 multidrug DMT transporter permease [Acidihalobacter yilgarnensis]